MAFADDGFLVYGLDETWYGRRWASDPEAERGPPTP